MKKINYLFFCLFLSVALLASCKSDDGGGDPGLTEEQVALAKLQGTWRLTAATKDGSPIPDYDLMRLTIDNKTMTATGTPGAESVFPTGTFAFIGIDFNRILVDEIRVDLVISETTLVTSFALNADGTDASRVTAVEGAYQFSFTKVE